MAKKSGKRASLVRSPTVLQMEATECGAASLGMVLAHFGRFVPLEKLREDCGISRDGSKASNILKAARDFGLKAKGFKRTIDTLKGQEMPAIIHWNFNHFLVLDGFKKGKVYLNDPACGRRSVTEEEFNECFTGVALHMSPGPKFEPGGKKPSALEGVKRRAKGLETALLFVVLASLALSVPGLILPTFSRIFVDDILIAGKSDWLRPLLLGLGLTAVIRGALTWLRAHYLLRMFTKLSIASSASFFWHVLRLPIPFFLARYAGDIGGRIMLNDRLASLVSGPLANTGLDLLMVLCYGTLLFIYDWQLTVIGILIAAMNIGALQFYSRRRRDDNQRLQQETGTLVGVSMGGLQVIETIKSGGNEMDFFSRWAGHWAKVQNTAQELGIATLYLSTAPSLLSAINTTAILTIGGLRVMEGEMTVGMLVAYQTLMASFIAPVNNLVNLGTTLQETEADIKRLDDVNDHARAPGLEEDAEQELSSRFRKLEGSLSLKELTFGYSRFSPSLIDGFNLDLKPGDRVALVGGSGSGKSTIARMVAGLYRPWSGQILMDGRDRQEIPSPILNNSIGMVDQDLFLFEGTIRDNITLWDTSIPESEIIKAAKDAKIHEDISERPGGYDSPVEEGGRNFSGGQRQRLEIARALARNPTILLLDEATSALDPKTEKIIDDNLRRRGCTCVIVSHRLSTIRDCDEIIVLRDGDVVERGPHDSLMEQKGFYAQLMGAA